MPLRTHDQLRILIQPFMLARRIASRTSYDQQKIYDHLILNSVWKLNQQEIGIDRRQFEDF